MSGVTKSGAWAEKDSVWVLYRLAAAGGKDCPHHTSWQQLPKGICLNAIWQPSAISKPKSGDQFQGLKTLLHFCTRQQTLKCLSGWERRGPWFCRFLHVWGWFWRALFSCITRQASCRWWRKTDFFSVCMYRIASVPENLIYLILNFYLRSSIFTRMWCQNHRKVSSGVRRVENPSPSFVC